MPNYTTGAIAFLNDQQIIADIGAQGIVVIEIATGEIVRTIGKFHEHANYMAVSPDRKQLAISYMFDGVEIVDISSGKLIQRHKLVSAMKVEYHSSGQYLAVAHDEQVSLLNPITGEIIYESDTYLAGMVATFPKSPQFVTGSADGSIKLDALNSSVYRRIQNLVGPTTELLVSNDERRIYIFEVFDVYVLNVEKNEIIKTLFDFDIDNCPDYDVAEAMRGILSRDNQYLVTNGESGMLNVFETSDFKRLLRMDIEHDISMAITHDDKYLVTVSQGQSSVFTIREMPTGKKIVEHQY